MGAGGNRELLISEYKVSVTQDELSCGDLPYSTGPTGLEQASSDKCMSWHWEFTSCQDAAGIPERYFRIRTAKVTRRCSHDSQRANHIKIAH